MAPVFPALIKASIFSEASSWNPIAIDEVDLACKNHDKCYDDFGYFNKNCDLKILKDLKLISPRTETEKLAQRLLIFYFQESSKI